MHAASLEAGRQEGEKGREREAKYARTHKMSRK